MPARLRVYHALLAIGVVAAYFSTEWGGVHAWLGYGVAGVILFRLVLALTGAPQLGLMRFYPHFHGLKLGNAFTHPAISRVLLVGIAVCLIGVTATGIAMDKGRTLSLGAPPAVSAASPEIGARASSEGEDADEGRGDEEEEGDGQEGEEGGPLGELHELFGNGLMLLVAVHVSYLFLFKRPLARFMMFAAPKRPSAQDK